MKRIIVFWPWPHRVMAAWRSRPYLEVLGALKQGYFREAQSFRKKWGGWNLDEIRRMFSALKEIFDKLSNFWLNAMRFCGRAVSGEILGKLVSIFVLFEIGLVSLMFPALMLSHVDVCLLTPYLIWKPCHKYPGNAEALRNFYASVEKNWLRYNKLFRSEGEKVVNYHVVWVNKLIFAAKL